jgi:hypothetical protein
VFLLFHRITISESMALPQEHSVPSPRWATTDLDLGLKKFGGNNECTLAFSSPASLTSAQASCAGHL